jgi:LemA protein
MNWLPIIIPVAIILILILWISGSYNKLVSLSVRVDNGWAQVDVQLKKRFDLIPNLVETVKGYATHEKTTLSEVTKWRGAAMNSKTPEESMENNAKLSHAILNLFATAEQYPDLKANQNFLDLQSQLQDIESKIAISRQFYNDTAMKYNEYVMHFPSNIIASIFKFNTKKYFEIDEADKAVPQVKF